MLLNCLCGGNLSTHLLFLFVFLDLNLRSSFLYYRRVFLRCHGILLGSSDSVNFFRSTSICGLLVKLLQIGEHILRVISLPEFQVRTTLQELADTFRLTDTRHFHHDTTSLSFQFLDIRLNDTKLVDTSTYYVERVIDSCLHFLTQSFLHFSVSTLRRNLPLQLLRSEYFRQLMPRGILVISVNEMGNEITSFCFFRCPSLGHRLGKAHVGLMVSQGLHHVGNRDLKNNVHSTLQVKAKTDLSLQTVLVRIDTEILHGILVILLGNRIL